MRKEIIHFGEEELTVTFEEPAPRGGPGLARLNLWSRSGGHREDLISFESAETWLSSRRALGWHEGPLQD